MFLVMSLDLQAQRDEFIKQGLSESHKALIKFYKDTLSSEYYYKLVKSELDKEVIVPYNFHLLTLKNKYTGSPILKVVPLINRYNLLDNADITTSLAPLLGELSALVKSLQSLYTDNIYIQDFSVFLYILYCHSKEADYKLVQQLVAQFINSISTLGTNNPVNLIFHDYLGIAHSLYLWNDNEKNQRLRRTPHYVPTGIDSVASFYSQLAPALHKQNSILTNITPPNLIIKRTTQICKLDNLMLQSFIKYCQPKQLGYFLSVLRMRNKRACHEYADKFFPEVSIKIRVLSRKSKQAAELVNYTDKVVSILNSSIRTSRAEITFQDYNPFLEDTSPLEIYSTVSIDVNKALQGLPSNTYYKRLSEVISLAASINACRMSKFNNPEDELSLLKVDILDKSVIINIELENAIKDLIAELSNKYMYEFAYEVKRDYNPNESPYKLQKRTHI